MNKRLLDGMPYTPAARLIRAYRLWRNGLFDLRAAWYAAYSAPTKIPEPSQVSKPEAPNVGR